PPPVWNVFMNENYSKKGDEILIDPETRICSQPRVPLKILWLIDSFDAGDAEFHVYYLARYFTREYKHQIYFFSTRDGAMRKLFEGFSRVTCGEHTDAAIEKLHSEEHFDVAVVTSLKEVRYPEILSKIDLPATWQIASSTPLVERVQQHFQQPATIVFPSEEIAGPYRRLDTRLVARLLNSSVDLAEIKLYKQKNSPMDLRAALNVSRKSMVFTIAGPTVEERGQKQFVEAAQQLIRKQPGLDADFFIVGEREGPYGNAVKALVQGGPNAERFHFVPESADPASRYPYYWIADVCVTCSERETYPITTLEAMAFKKAVIGPNVFAVNEVIEQDENGLLYDPGMPGDLAGKMEELLANRDYVDALGRISLEMAMEKFALKKSAARLERYLRESIVYVP
ncbi:MAG TPA: glycosyltransferase family 4 protein, partial [Acidobacteriota bacterium]|nr:glycosyltransferase family 4 protein [Acidobacteriota bacterium]